ncbi:MAG TPA: hypothetical protein VFK78_09640 [Gemmatimonadales bacterium]|nr:hypothetical protein [Gemmatimonadales bacterium]
MRLLTAVLAAGLAAHPLAAQAVERTDTPRRGLLRLTFDPSVVAWDEVFGPSGRVSLGAPLSGDSVGPARIPALAQLQQDIRTAGRVPGFVAALGKSLLAVRNEQRILPVNLQLGLSDRLALGVLVPFVRVRTRAHLAIDSTSGSLGLNPRRAGVAGADSAYTDFFTRYDATLAQFDANIGAGGYGCPPSRQCQAQQVLDSAIAIRDALDRSANAPFLPRAGSDGGLGIDTTLAHLQDEIATTYSVAGLPDTFLLPAGPLTADQFQTVVSDSANGFGVAPLDDNPLYRAYYLGDVELSLKYRAIVRPSYALAVTGLLRLPTGHLDNPRILFDVPTGDHQTDIEGRVIQELTVAKFLWLNLSLRAAHQFAGSRERLVAAPTDFLVLHPAFETLAWKPGDYAAIDFAPLVRLTPYFAVGMTTGYFVKREDRYSYRDPADSAAVTATEGAPVAAGVLDAGTAAHWWRLGAAITYLGPSGIEGGFSMERTVSGAGRLTPAAMVWRIVFRTSRRLF